MLKLIELRDVGPAREMRLEFSRRLNLLTGDNGLGKSFILDIAWWALTRNWSGRKAVPQAGRDRNPSIAFSFDSVSRKHAFASSFERQQQRWTNPRGRPANPGLVIYGRVDGGFSVWDPARNYWKTLSGRETPDRPPAYNFEQIDIWDGLVLDGKQVCNGLIRDWGNWQISNAPEFAILKKVLERLSPTPDEKLIPGNLAKIDIDDARLVPTIVTSYGEEVPVVYISAGMKRVIALAYILVWAWQEHLRAAEFLSVDHTKQIIFLIDEIESHLHPKWQRVILQSVLGVVDDLASGPADEVQIVASTHSPIVLASIEASFDSRSDAWFDIDIVADDRSRRVELRKKQFVRQGNVSNWLTSDAFNLESDRPREAQLLLSQAATLLADSKTTIAQLENLGTKLGAVLPDSDPFWRRWKVSLDRRQDSA